MGQLAYRTNGNRKLKEDLNEEQRVYFACHPDDFASCFDAICQDIFETHDCVIWYDSDYGETSEAEERQLELDRMQLIVVPITYNFLCRKNFACDVEIPYALEQKIPILALKRTGSLDYEYAQIFRDLQYLDKNAAAADQTELPYERKLKDFLDEVLAGDSLRSGVREAFAAWFFMSYRKIDRKYAQDLMKLIHWDDLCRDVAIWYDEYLLPNEHFNQTIRDAMKRSDLISFVVTPNLLEPNDQGEKNYVMDQEYPIAKASEKPIMATQMLPTDLDLLNQCYPDIQDELVDVEDGKKFEADLRERICRLSVEQSDEPEHLYKIGMAYLYGLYVETNRTRGSALIAAAAEAGYPDAMQLLFMMYLDGIGVEVNYEESKKWGIRFWEACKEEFDRTGSQETGDRQLEAERAMIALQLFAGQPAEGEKWAERFEVTANQLLKAFPDMKYKQALFEACDYRAIARERQGHLADAKSEYLRSLDLLDKLDPNAEEKEEREETNAVYFALGLISYQQGELDEARDWYQKILDHCENTDEKTRSDHSKRVISRAYEGLGLIKEEVGHFSDAEGYFVKSCEMAEDGSDEEFYKRFMAGIQKHLGEIRREEGKISDAKAFFQNSLKLYEEVDQKFRSIDSRRDLARAYYDMSLLVGAETNRPYDEKLLKNSKEINEKLLNDTAGWVLIKADLGGDYAAMGQLCKSEGDFKEAEEFYNKSIDLLEKVSGETEDLDAGLQLASLYVEMGVFFEAWSEEAEGDAEDCRIKAKDYYRDSSKLLEKLAERSEVIRVQCALAHSYARLASFFEKEGTNRLPVSQKWAQKALDRWKEINQKTDLFVAKEELAKSYSLMALILEEMGDAEQAAEDYNESLRLFDELLADPKAVSAELKNAFVVACNDFGGFLESRDDSDGALKIYQKGLPTIEQVCSEDASKEISEDSLLTLVDSYFYIGSVHRRKKQWDNAEENYKKALDVIEKLSDTADLSKTNDPEILKRAANIYFNWGTLEKSDRARLERSKSYWEKLVSLDKSYASNYQEKVDRIKSLIELLYYRKRT